MQSRYAIIQEETPEIALEDVVTPRSVLERELDNQADSKAHSPSPSLTRNAKTSISYAPVATASLDDFDDTEDSKPPLQSTQVLIGDEHRDALPPINLESGTKLQCLFTIVAGILCSLACIFCSIGFWVSPKAADRTSFTKLVIYLPIGLPSEAFSLVVNIALTQCLEGLAYVHSISLRWALLKENRLIFNTNIRLITSSRFSRANSWYMNSISATLLILCYGSTSMLFIPTVDLDSGTTSGTCVNLIALLALGLALLGQGLLAIWCYCDNLHDIPSWGSNPLNTTILVLDQNIVQHREGRCMVPVQIQEESEAMPVLPRARQPSQWQASTAARNAIIFIWILAGLSFAWFLTVVFVTRTTMKQAIDVVGPSANSTWHYSMAWNPSINTDIEGTAYITYYNAVLFSMSYADLNMSFIVALILGLLFICAIQGLQTLGLHCAELIVNLSRDEDVWRALDVLNAQGQSSGSSKVLATPPFLAALLSWKSIMLFLFKSILHWLLGQSSQSSVYLVDGTVWFTMSYSRLFVYVICAIAFASSLTFLTLVNPKGPQPATFGHIQTIADVVDDWTLKDGHFWWGDKGGNGIRHAGMSCEEKRLGKIQMDALYAGAI